MSRTASLAMIGAAALAFAGCGDAAKDPDRTVEIDMVDIAFEPAEVNVTAGETVRFVFTNQGKIPHDAYIGDAAAQVDHAAAMADRDGGHGAHDGDSSGVTVDPGETAEVTYTFAAGGDVLIGCHQPGHYEAGMVTSITVSHPGSTR